MIKNVVSTGTDMFYEFKILGHYSVEVMLEQMSKAGVSVALAMKDALKSSAPTHTMTRVSVRGAYLTKSPTPRTFGARESHQLSGEDSDPSNMSAFIDSFLMEASHTLVVNGMHPSYRPSLRKGGKVIGFGKRQSAVGKETHAIMRRMNDGSLNNQYPTRSQLSTDEIGSKYAQKGASAAQSKVSRYLKEGYGKVLTNAITHEPTRETRFVI